jgi:hypothetical protein
LTLKYLLSNERLDIFWPDVKPKLNSFLDETEKWKKRNASGEAKFQENLKIPVTFNLLNYFFLYFIKY